MQASIRICPPSQLADHRMGNDRVLKSEPYNSRDTKRGVDRLQRLAPLVQLQEQIARKQSRHALLGLPRPSHAVSEPREIDFKALSLKILLSQSFPQRLCVDQVPAQHSEIHHRRRCNISDCVQSLNAGSL